MSGLSLSLSLARSVSLSLSLSFFIEKIYRKQVGERFFSHRPSCQSDVVCVRRRVSVEAERTLFRIEQKTSRAHFVVNISSQVKEKQPRCFLHAPETPRVAEEPGRVDGAGFGELRIAVQ